MMMFNEPCYVKVAGTYQGGQIALRIIGESGEPFATATVNEPGVSLTSDEVIIKNYRENEGVLDLLVADGAVAAPRRYSPAGNPICRLLLTI